MDPLAHTFTGAVLAASGLRKITPLATAALLIGANAPDIDILVAFTGDYMSLAHRRGWTHGVLAWVILPLLVTALLISWDKWVRLRRNPDAAPVNFQKLLLLAALGVLSHPLLDWLNNYGIRLLMPFDSSWFYGDALFIIDPWVWLLLGGPCFLVWSQGKFGFTCWSVFWVMLCWLVIGNDLTPDLARYPLAMWLICLYGLRLIEPGLVSFATGARFGLGLAVLYMVTTAIASNMAEQRVRHLLVSQSPEPVLNIMVGPVATNPFSGTIVAVTKTEYILGSWHWLSRNQLELNPVRIKRNLQDPLVQQAATDVYATRFLSWSRFPFAVVTEDKSGFQVRFTDARYAGLDGGIGGPTVHLDRDLQFMWSNQ